MIWLGDLKASIPEPKVVPADGKPYLLHEFKPFDTTKIAVIVAMGVSQHPGTTYIYNSDGRKMETPVPLGEFHRPLFTCRDLKQWLAIGEAFTIHVINNDPDGEAHRYASLLWTFDQSKGVELE